MTGVENKIVFSIAMNSFTSYAAVMLNIVAIIALRKTPSLPKPLKVLLLSISVSDLCVGLLVQPLYVALHRINGDKPIFTTLARVNTISTTFFCTATLLGICAVSVDRFLAIHLHLRYQEIVTHRRVVAVVISIWVLSAVLSVPRTNTFEKADRIILAIIVFITLGCLVAIAIIYVKLYLVLKHHIMQVHALHINLDSQDAVAIEDTARQKKSAVVIFYLYLTLLICYLPNTFIALMLALSSVRPPSLVFLFSDALLFLNSSLDPLIYCWKMRQVRLTAMNMLRNMHFKC
ncbi:alpha-1B adrenergic receptor-like [Porites lutea]|uniref:alpha-1B adrenergic receptor-like n=1 Tax=Porites lutea TaxID=51062 RepID=UPI003CC6472A